MHSRSPVGTVCRMSSKKMVQKPWYADGVRFECRQSGQCCTNHGSYSRVYLEDDEAKEVARLKGISLKELEREWCYREEGHRLVQSRNNACAFLDGHRCTVYEARPHQCRTWPFWKENLKPSVWKRDVEAFCPGVGKGKVYSAQEIEEIADSEP